MILDDLLKLRDGGASPRVTATESGLTSTTRDATTGQACIDVSKMPAQGMPIVVINDADTGTSNDKTAIVTIEACDTVDGSYQEIKKFPTISHGAAAGKMVRTVATQKKYIRSVITVAGSNGTISIDFGIFIGIGAVEEG